MRFNKFSFYCKRSILCALPILITSCGMGGITLDSTDGSKIKFKNENVFCITGDEYKDFWTNVPTWDVRCTANGVRTFLTGDRTNFSQTKLCKTLNSKGKVLDNFNENSFACLAASKLKKIK